MKKSKAFGISMLWILLFLGVQVIISAAVSIGSLSSGSEATDIIAGSIPTSLVLCNIIIPLLVLIIVKLNGEKWSSALCLRKASFRALLISLIFAVSLAPLISYLLDLIPLPDSLLNFYNDVIGTVADGSNALSVAATVFLGPLCEELVFRGAIFNTLKKAFSTTGAVLISAFLFGLVHLNPIQSTYAFIIGIFLCIVCIRFDSLWPSVIFHMAFNVIGGYFDIYMFGSTVQMIILIVCAVVAFSVAVWMAVSKKK